MTPASTADKILVVDDTAMNRTMLRRILTKGGYELLEAVDGESALETAANQPVDLVLLDILMPGKDGYEVCAELKSQTTYENTPVIFLSAKANVESKVRGFDVGGADYITKPFKSQEVLARVRTQLKIASLTRSLTQANDELILKQQLLDRDLRAAADIQRSLIPQIVPEISGIDTAWRFLPCDQIGGDIFNVVRLDDHHWGFFMIDVSGHGVPSAMVTVSVSQSLGNGVGGVLKEEISEEPFYRISEPWEVLATLDDEYPMDRFDKYFTMCYAIIDTRTLCMRYSCGAHPMPVIIRASGGYELLEAGGSIIGLGGLVPFEEGRIEFHPGDRLFLYTDGIVEMANATGECYGEEKLYELLDGARTASLDDACGTVVDSAFEHAGATRGQDDITILGIEFKE